ncbi:MAG: adenylate kinase [Candidatus Limnocylindria bacterium]
MRRINVVGTSCSGKTTLARRLATAVGVRHVELDALYWGPDWQPVATELFEGRVRQATDAPAWVVDGGYRSVRHITWSRVDTIVWLDYPLHLVLSRWARRTLARVQSREEFWPGTGNRERMSHIAGRDSLLWWILTTHRGRRQRLVEHLALRPDLRLVHLRSPSEAEAWIASIAGGR